MARYLLRVEPEGLAIMNFYKRRLPSMDTRRKVTGYHDFRLNKLCKNHGLATEQGNTSNSRTHKLRPTICLEQKAELESYTVLSTVVDFLNFDAPFWRARSILPRSQHPSLQYGVWT